MLLFRLPGTMHHQFLFQSLLLFYVSTVSIVIAGPHQFPPLTALPTAANHVSYSPAAAPGPGEAGGAITGGSNAFPANGPGRSPSQAPAMNQPCLILLLSILCMVLSLRM